MRNGPYSIVLVETKSILRIDDPGFPETAFEAGPIFSTSKKPVKFQIMTIFPRFFEYFDN